MKDVISSGFFNLDWVRVLEENFAKNYYNSRSIRGPNEEDHIKIKKV